MSHKVPSPLPMFSLRHLGRGPENHIRTVTLQPDAAGIAEHAVRTDVPPPSRGLLGAAVGAGGRGPCLQRRRGVGPGGSVIHIGVCGL